VEGDFLVAVEPTDLSALPRLMHPQRLGLTEAELAAAIAEACENRLQGLTRAYLEQDLCYTREVARAVEQELHAFLGSLLGSWGLGVRAVGQLAFVPTRVALERAERLRALEEGLARLEQRKALSAEERRRQWEELLAQQELEAALQALEREEELEEARAAVLKAPETPATPGETSTADPGVLKERLRSLRSALEMAVAARLDRLLRRKEEAKEEVPEDPAKDLQRAVTALRWAGAFFVSATGFLVAFAPWLFPDLETPRRITAAVGFGVTLVTFGASVWLRTKVRKRRHQAAVEAHLLGRLRLKDRREADRILRGEVGDALARVASNVESARRAAFRAEGGRDLAVDLHGLLGEVERVRQEVLSTPSGGVPWLDEERLPADLLLQMMAFDQSVLRSAADAAQQSEEMAAAALSQDLDRVRSLAKELGVGLLHLRNRFQARGRLAAL
jgi:hypothetical protein